MVFFAINRRGYEDFIALNFDAILWSTLGVLTTVFNFQLASDDADAISDAVETIRGHHPGQTVWLST